MHMESVLLGRFTAQGNMHWCWQGYIKRKVVFSVLDWWRLPELVQICILSIMTRRDDSLLDDDHLQCYG